jgi:hypothetical protein
MSTALPSDVASLPENPPVKPAWVRPTLDVVDVVNATQAGGAVSADQDPNQPS